MCWGKDIRMKVIVNGLGCTHTGSKFVMEQLLFSSPVDLEILAIIPIVKNIKPIEFPKHIKQIKLVHRFWGAYLRPFLEIYLNILMAFKKYEVLINLSNYGFCFTKHQKLYIHNPNILDISAPRRIGKGNANIFNRFALNTFLRHGQTIFVQTHHMYSQLMTYCNNYKIQTPAEVVILKPPFPNVEISHPIDFPKKNYEFQLFYPASLFPHKRTDLAIDSIRIVRGSSKKIGLNITIEPEQGFDGVSFLGQIERSDVYKQFLVCNALFFTSERETLGLPLLEALYFEKPAILPNVDYAREIYGEAGIYYTRNTPEEIAGAIFKLFQNYDHYIALTKNQKSIEIKSRLTWKEHWEAFLR